MIKDGGEADHWGPHSYKQLQRAKISNIAKKYYIYHMWKCRPVKKEQNVKMCQQTYKNSLSWVKRQEKKSERQRRGGRRKHTSTSCTS